MWFKWNFALPEDSRRKIAQSVPGEDEAVPEYGRERYLLLNCLLFSVLQGHPDQQVRVKSSRVHTTRVVVHSGAP